MEGNRLPLTAETRREVGSTYDSEPSTSDKRDKMILELQQQLIQKDAELVQAQQEIVGLKEKLIEKDTVQTEEDHYEPMEMTEYLEEHPSHNYETTPDGRKIPYFTYTNFAMKGYIGSGGYGEVNKCYDKLNKRFVAVKSFKAIDHIGNAREIEFLSTHTHKHIVRFWGAIRNISHKNGTVSIEYPGYVMEYIDAGSLDNEIHESPDTYNMKLVCLWIDQISSALQFLHDNGLIHRDINPKNILVAAPDMLKLTDFGLVRKITGSKLTNCAGNSCYRAPEVINSTNYGKPADIFSFGITIWEIIHRLRPHEFIKYPDDHSSNIALPFDQNRLSKKMVNFMERCWHTSPASRPELTDISKIFWDLRTSNINISRALIAGNDPAEHQIYRTASRIPPYRINHPDNCTPNVLPVDHQKDRTDGGLEAGEKRVPLIPKKFMLIDPRLPILQGNMPWPQAAQTIGTFTERHLGKCRVIQAADSRRGQEYYLEIEHGEFGKTFVKYFENRNEVYSLAQSCRKMGFLEGVDRLTEKDRDKQREITFASQLSHPNIMKVLGYISPTGKSEDIQGLIMEGASLGTLETYAKKSQLSDNVLKLYALQLADALRYCHDELHIIHRDVRPRNIYVHDTGETIKLGNFGIAREEDSEMKTANKGDELYYKAPEMIYSGNTTCYSYPVDVYGYALVIWSISRRGSRPFWDENRMLCVNSFTFRAYLEKSNKNRPEIREDLDPLLVKVLQECWVTDPEQRPLMADVVTVFNKLR